MIRDDDAANGQPVQPPRGPSLSDADMDLLTLPRAIGAKTKAVEGENWVNLYFADASHTWRWHPLMHSDDALNLSAQPRIDIE